LRAPPFGSVILVTHGSSRFGAFTINGALSLVICLLYRQPLVFLWTMPGAVLSGQALDHLPFTQ